VRSCAEPWGLSASAAHAGPLVLDHGGRFLEYQSLLERDWMLLLDFDREVEWICEQPLRLRYSKDEKRASHVPDLLVWRAGTPELCDVKERRAS